MLPTQEIIDRLAERIERAFLRRCAAWNRSCSTSRVWGAAAINLWEAHQAMPELPVDPELYVEAQPIQSRNSDPWSDLTGVEARHRYARRVRKIVRLLRDELSREIALVDRLVSRGIELCRIVSSRKLRLSALGCYIVVLRARRDDLAADLHDRALEQHLSCPLYRVACSAFLPEDFYPGAEPRGKRMLSPFATNLGVYDGLVN